MDRHAIETLGIPARVLMEDAAQQVSLHARRLALPDAPIAVCCGPGNNGGDGYALARLLANAGHDVTVIALGAPKSSEARDNAAAWAHFGPTLHWENDTAACHKALAHAGLLVDALFGVGLQRPLEGAALALVLAINSAAQASGAGVLGVDVPSGLHTDTGQVLGGAVHCTETVNLQAGKPACHQHPGVEYSGRVHVAPISIPERWDAATPGTWLLGAAGVAALLPTRPAAGHKGSFGHVLGVCGSAGMAGAALLAGRAALASGCGLLTMALPGALRDAMLAAAPEMMTLPSPGDAPCFRGDDAEWILKATEDRAAMMLGPGLGRAPETAPLVERLTAEVKRPMLVDADGLYHLTPDMLRKRAAAGAPATVITPHPGEMARLTGLSGEELAANRLGHARHHAMAWGTVVLLKGAGTIIAAPDGRACINPTGDHGLASGGTGDVLSGIITGLMAQGAPAFEAALAGAFLHGLARDFQSGSVHARVFTASDIIRGLSHAFFQLEQALPG